MAKQTPVPYDEVFELAAQTYGVDADLLKAMAWQESRFNPNAVGPKTKYGQAVGMMQFLPNTAKEYGVNPLDPVESIAGAAMYLRKNLDRFGGDIGKAVAAYNTGPNRSAFQQDDWINRVAPETRDYVFKVLDQADAYYQLRPQPTEETESQVAPPAEPGFMERVGLATKRGFEQIPESAQGVLLGIRSALGDDAAAQKQIQEILAERKAAGKEPQPISWAELEKTYQKEGLLSALSKAPTYVVEQILQSAPSMAVPLAVGSGVAAVSGPAGVVTGPVAGIATYGLQQFGQFMQRQAEEKQQAAKLEPGKAAAAAAATAPIGYFADRFLLGAGKVPAKILGEQAAMELAKRAGAKVAAGATIGVIAEAPTEVLESVAERWQAGLPLMDDEAVREYKESFFGAAAVGGVGGAASGALTRPRVPEKEEEPPAPQPSAAPAAPEAPTPEAPAGNVISQEQIDIITANYPVGIRETVRRQLAGRTIEDLRAEVEDDPEILTNESLGAQAIRSILGIQPGREAERPAAEPSVGVPSGVAGQPAPAQPAAPVRAETPQPERMVPSQPDAGLQPEAPRPVAPTVTETELGTQAPQTQQAEAQGAQPETLAPDTGGAAQPVPAAQPPQAAGVAFTWGEMDRAQREQMAVRAGLKQVPATEAAAKPWSRLTKEQKDKIAGVMQVEPAPVLEIFPEPTAEPEQIAPPEPDVSREQQAIADLEKDRRRLMRQPGGNLRGTLMGSLPADEVRDISPDLGLRPLQARPDKKPTSLSTWVANGALNDFLPFEMRNDSPTFDETDAVEYIKERLRNREHYTYETQAALRQIDLRIGEIEAAMREHLSLRETNLLIQEAFDEQRRIDEEAEGAPAKGEDRVAAPAPAVAAEPELTAEEEARLEREAIQAESEQEGLTRPTPESLKEAEDRAIAAEKAAEQARKDAEKAEAEAKKERERREIAERSAAAAKDFELGQTAEENLTGQKGLDLVAQAPVVDRQPFLSAFRASLQTTIPPFQAISKTGRRSVKPKPLTDKQVALVVDLANDAIDLGLPPQLLGKIKAAGATSMQSVAAIGSERGWFMLGSQWPSADKALRLHGVVHELGHTVDYDNKGHYTLSNTPEWKKAHEELRNWYSNTPPELRGKHPLSYPFLPQFAGKVNMRAETYAQAFAYYFTDPVSLQANAPEAFAQIHQALERIKNEPATTQTTGTATGTDVEVDVQAGRTAESATVQPSARQERTGVSGTERVEDRAGEELIDVEMMAAPESLEEQAKRQNVFGDGTISTWTYPTEVKIIGKTNKDDLIYSLQDKQVDTKRVIEAIRSTSKEIASKWDAYLQETLFHGRTAKQTQDFLNKELEPALEEMRKRGITKAELGEYMHNRHAPEANAVIAARNPRFPDGGSGIKTADALRYMSELSPKKKADLEAAAAKFDAILKGTRDLIAGRTVNQDGTVIYKNRMEPSETIDALEEMYAHYIPLVRADADYSVGKGLTQGAGYSVSGREFKGRTGSAREVVHDEILANIAMARELAIVRTQKNRVAQAVVGLAIQYPNPGFWLALDPATNPVWKANETQDALDLLREIAAEGDMSPEQSNQYDKEIRRLEALLKKQNKQSLAALDKLREDFDEVGIDRALIDNIMKPPLKPRYDPKTNKVVYESRASFSNPHVFSAKFNGSDKFVLFNANDPRAKRMAEALKGMDADTLGRTMSIIAKVTRYFASINTQYNPIFGAINFLRDVQGAVLQITTTPIADKKKQVIADTGPAMAAIYRSTRAATKKRQGKEGQWDRLWEEFQVEGGQTGFRDQFSQSAERAEALQKMLDPSSWAESPLGKFFTANGTLKAPFEVMRKGSKPVFDWLSDYNTTMENAVRLSAYKAAKDKFLAQNMDEESAKQEAARVAKELTVNFNRKGQVATQMGALYAFFNAAVQGTTRMAQTLRGPAGKKILGGAFLLGSMQALWLAAAGFDEDEPPQFIKERNIVIPLDWVDNLGGPGMDGQYLAIPLPLGFNVLPNLSRILTEAAIASAEGRPINAPKRIEQIASSLFDAFNPIGNAGWSFQTFAPTIADPMVALRENKDWTGKPIARKDMSELDPSPGYTRAKESATWLSEQLAYYLNLASGGTDAKRGLISPTPDQLDYLGGQITGGLGREIGKVMKTAESQVTGQDLPQYNIPVWGRFFGDITSTANVSNRFYENITKLNEHQAEIKSLREKKENVSEYIKDNPEARLYNFADTVYRDVSQLRKRRRELVEAGAPKERVRALEERITNRMRQLNDRIEAAEKR